MSVPDGVSRIPPVPTPSGAGALFGPSGAKKKRTGRPPTSDPRLPPRARDRPPFQIRSRTWSAAPLGAGNMTHEACQPPGRDVAAAVAVQRLATSCPVGPRRGCPGGAHGDWLRVASAGRSPRRREPTHVGRSVVDVLGSPLSRDDGRGARWARTAVGPSRGRRGGAAIGGRTARQCASCSRAATSARGRSRGRGDLASAGRASLVTDGAGIPDEVDRERVLLPL